jgi:hypothetical protein
MLCTNTHGMVGAERRMTGRRSQSLAQLERDAALARVNRVRRWTFVGAAGLTAGVAALVSAVAPGRSLGAKTRLAEEVALRQVPRTSSRPQMPPLASAGELGLQGPSSSPQAAQAQTQAPTQDPSQAAQTPAPAPASVPAPAVSGGS